MLNVSFRADYEESKKGIYLKHGKSIEGNIHLRESITRMMEQTKPPKSPLSAMVLYFLTMKAFKTHWALTNLCIEGFSEDAGILLRSLFETLVTAFWILKENPEDRAQRYINFDYILTKRLIDSIEKWKKIYPKLEEMNVYDKDDVLKNYAKMEDEYKDKIRWSGKNWKEMAKDVGLEYDYDLNYHYFSQFVHPSIRSALRFVEIKSNDIVFEMFSKKSTEFIGKVLYHAYFYMLLLIKKWNEELNAGQDKLIEELIKISTPLEAYKDF
jgi:hypothetical protein